MRRELVPDELWSLVEPVIPKWTPSPKGGKPRLEDRRAFTGILFVLKTGIPWEDLPQEMGCGCGMSCWRRLREWMENGTWDAMHRVLLDKLRANGKLDFDLSVIDSASVRAVYGGSCTGRNPTDRGKRGSKHHVLVDGEEGAPVATEVTGANRHDVTQLEPLVNKVPPIAGKVGHPKEKPSVIQGDRAYGSKPHKERLNKRGIKTLLAQRNTEHGSGLGTTRWIVVERTLAWMHQYRRLRVRYEKRGDIHAVLLLVSAIHICFKLLML